MEKIHHDRNGMDRYISLEANPHFKNGGSFWMIINPYVLKSWWLGNQPMKNGGWTSKKPMAFRFSDLGPKLPADAMFPATRFFTITRLMLWASRFNTFSCLGGGFKCF